MSQQEATIIRAKHSALNPYFPMLRTTAQDENISWEARGVIAYLLSKPDDWEIMVKDLEQKCAKGRVYRIIKELIEAGYLEDRVRSQDKEGKFHYTPYKLHEQPIKKPTAGKIIKLETQEQSALKPDNPVSDEPLPQKPYTDKPLTGEPYTEEPRTENADLNIREKDTVQSKHNIENKKENNNKQSSSDFDISFGDVAEAYESNIGLITPMLREQLSEMYDTYTGQWVLDAFAIAVKRNTRKLSYVEGILKNWKRDGKQELKFQPEPLPVADTTTTTAPAEMHNPFEGESA